MTGHGELSALPGALRHLAAALDEVLALAPLLPLAAAGPAARTDAGTGTRTGPGPYGAAGRTDATAPDGETLVALLWPTPATGVTLMRDVERRPRTSGTTAYRGRVRWIDPATGQYRGHTRTFDTPAEAWAWVRTYTAPEPAPMPAPDGEMHPPPGGTGPLSAARSRGVHLNGAAGRGAQ
jgi:hypothetical protein